MNTVIEIGYTELVEAFLIIAIPIAWMLIYKVRIIKDILIALVRMVLQLILVAVYLEWIFALNSAYINTLWAIFMVLVGIQTSIKRIGLNWRYFAFPFLISSLTTILIIDTFFLGFIIKLPYLFDARYFIPITGMVLGNSLNHNVVGLTTYYEGLRDKSDLYYFILTNSGDHKKACRPFISDAVKKGLNPMIANMSVMGLISLPGMMTGQILGGSSPVVAIKYQVLIMLAIFTGCSINLFLSILLSNRFIFDGYNRFKEEVMK